jgi:hypothetical protein
VGVGYKKKSISFIFNQENSDMIYGPVELLVVKFPGNQLKGEIAPALADLVQNGTIRIIDLIFAKKDADGNLTVVEINDLTDEEFTIFDSILSDGLTGLLAEDDVTRIAERLENNSSAGLILFENVWATAFAQAVRNAAGEILLNERIPRAVIEELLTVVGD